MVVGTSSTSFFRLDGKLICACGPCAQESQKRGLILHWTSLKLTNLGLPASCQDNAKLPLFCVLVLRLGAPARFWWRPDLATMPCFRTFFWLQLRQPVACATPDRTLSSLTTGSKTAPGTS